MPAFRLQKKWCVLLFEVSCKDVSDILLPIATTKGCGCKTLEINELRAEQVCCPLFVCILEQSGRGTMDGRCCAA